MLQLTHRGSWAPHGLCVSRGGGVTTGATLPWPLSGGSLQFLFAVLTRRSQSEGAGVKAAEGGTTRARLERRRSGRSRALTQERPKITLRGLPRTENRSGQPQARGAAPKLHPIPEASETRPGHGEPSTGFVLVAHSPASQRPFVQQWSGATCAGCGAAWPHAGRLRTPAPCQARACASYPSARVGLQSRSASTEVRLARPTACAGGQTAGSSCWCAQ